MRIAMKRGAIPTPCETFGYGEVEDYSIEIVDNSTLNGQLNKEIKEQLSKEIKVYPNPSKGSFTVSFNRLKDDFSLNVYNVLGQLVFSKSYSSKKNVKMNIEKPGIYFIKYKNENGKILISKILIR
jgi:antitoxin component YwqK of YwqJK toxin-antitoxin module